MSQIKLKKNKMSTSINSELKHFFKDIIDKLSDERKNPNFHSKFPEVQYYYLKIGMNGYEKTIKRKQISYARWINKTDKEIRSLSTFRKAKESLKSLHKKTSTSLRGIPFDKVLLQLLKDYLL